MSITQLRSTMTDAEWDSFSDSIESACDALSVIRDLSANQADEIRNLWDALHIAEKIWDDIVDLDNYKGDDNVHS